jgi:hypothetical protein
MNCRIRSKSTNINSNNMKRLLFTLMMVALFSATLSNSSLNFKLNI